MAMLQMADEESMSSLEAFTGQKKGRIIAQFHMAATHLPEESNKAGRPIYKDEEYIRLIVPGSQDIICRPVRESDKDEYPREYQAFKNKQAAPESGTPLATLPFVGPAVAAELAAINVHTAEQLVAMADVHAGKVMGFHKLKARVQQFLEAAAGAAPAEALRNEIKKKDEELAVLKKALEDQGRRIDKLTNK